MVSILAILAFTLQLVATAQYYGPVAELCDPALPGVVCVNRYMSVLPHPFFRNTDPNNSESLGDALVPGDPSFALIKSAKFLVFNRNRALPLLGASPDVRRVFNTTMDVHVGATWEPSQNKIYFSKAKHGQSSFLVIDLNGGEPTLGEFTSKPPIYVALGGMYRNGLIYWTAGGGNITSGQRQGIRTLDPKTGKSRVLLNNYFGHYFTSPNDLAIDAKGDIWFTDTYYAWYGGYADIAPQLPAATYRFRPSTGEVSIVEDSLMQPNGIAISADQKHIFIVDTGGLASPLYDQPGNYPLIYNATKPRSIYKFDIVNGVHLANKRAIYNPLDWLGDGLKVAENGFILTAAGYGIDVLDEYGSLIMRAQTDFICHNLVWAGKELKDLWVVGIGGVAKVTWELKGPNLR